MGRRDGASARKVGLRQSLRLFVSSSLRLFVFLLFLLFALPAFGATLAEYREKIQDAEVLTEDLLFIDDEELSATERAKHEREILAELRQSLPSEKIEWRGSVVETDNKWLQDSLNNFEKETNPAKRQTILNGITERLSAIEQKLDELENPSASNRSKDEEKRKLSEILSREEYRKAEKQEESFIQKLIKKIKAWFAREAPETPEMSPSTWGGFQSLGQFLQILLYGLIIAAIGFLIYKFLPFVAGRFKNREKREKKERVILGERIGANESAANLFSEAELLAREGNLRGAIRKGYIALLCELSDRKLIGLAQHKTNRDYLRDVRKKRELHENMNGLTQNFERHWYGTEETEEKDWEEFRNGYFKTVGNGQSAVGSRSRQ